jgi:hypothetical protein
MIKFLAPGFPPKGGKMLCPPRHHALRISVNVTGLTGMEKNSIFGSYSIEIQ